MKGRTKKETHTPTHIIGNFYMDADSHQYVLVEKVTRTKVETNETYEGVTTHGYYTTVEALLNTVIDICVRKKIQANKIPTIKEVISEIKQLKIELQNICF